MRTIASLFLLLSFLSSHSSFATDYPPTYSQYNKNDLLIKIQSIEDYLKYIDLRAVYISPLEDGAPGLLLGVPGLGIKRADVIAYYFKSGTNYENNMINYDNTAAARVGHTGGGWSCIVDEKKETAEMDIAAINKEFFSSAQPVDLTDKEKERVLKGHSKLSQSKKDQMIALAEIAKGKLQQRATGFRLIPVPLGGIQTACQAGSIIPPKAPWGDENSMPVDIWAVWKGQKTAKTPVGKADSYIIYGESFGEEFIWDKTANGVVTHSDELIQMYTDMGFVYSED